MIGLIVVPCSPILMEPPIRISGTEATLPNPVILDKSLSRSADLLRQHVGYGMLAFQCP